MRGGLTRAEWATGEIPVVPYPVESARWKVEYSNSEGVGLLVRVEPSHDSQLRPTVFSMNMVPRVVDGKTAVGSSRAGRRREAARATIGATSASPGQALSGAGAEAAGTALAPGEQALAAGAGAPDLPRLRGPGRLLRPGAAGVAQDAPVSRLASFVAAARRAPRRQLANGPARHPS